MRGAIANLQCMLAISLAQPASAQAPTASRLRLTPIEDGFSGAACRLHLDQQGKVLVGGVDYYNDNRRWHLGVNGREYRLTDINPKGAGFSLASADRAISARITKLRKVWESRDPSYPAEKHQVSIRLNVRGSTATFIAYQLCGDG